MVESQVILEQRGSSLWRISLLGEHDLSTLPQLQNALDDVFSKGTTIVIDLSDTTFIDSSVIRTLIQAQARANATAGEELVLVAPPGRDRPKSSSSPACARCCAFTTHTKTPGTNGRLTVPDSQFRSATGCSYVYPRGNGRLPRIRPAHRSPTRRRATSRGFILAAGREVSPSNRC